MDTQIFYAINNLAGHSHALDLIGIFFAKYFEYVFAVFVVLLWFKKELRTKVYLAIISSVIARLVIVEILKRLFAHPRPYEVLQVHQLIADNERGVSFPSGHAAVFFALAFSFWGTKYFWPLFIFALIASVARVFVGVHYPGDIIVGLLISAATVFVIKKLIKKYS